MRTSCIMAAVFTALACAGLWAKPHAHIYVSPQGNDSWSGHLPAPNADKTDGPYKTLFRASQKAGSFADSSAPVTVHLRAGTYPVGRTIQLRHSGPSLTLRPYQNEKVRIIGGRRISGFKKVTDRSVLARLAPEARSNVVRLDLKALDITDFGRIRPRGFSRPTYPAHLELFHGGKPMQLARWPNQGWMRIAAVPAGKQGGKFAYEGDRPERWSKAQDIWLHGYWTQDWADSYVKVKSIDTENSVISTEEPHGVYGYTKGRRYYAFNILAELDTPGEWYLESPRGRLYFWPPGLLEGQDTIVSLLEEPIIEISDSKNVTIRGLNIECTRGNAIKIRGGSKNRIVDCTIRNIGNIAVSIAGGVENGLEHSHIYNTGDGGARLSGGDRKTLTPAGLYADDNHFHHYSRWCRTYRPAIGISGVGNRAAHNHIHDAPHTGILFGGNEHLLEFNEIHDVCRETGDVGAFYTGRDWTTRGTVIRHNYFHDIHGPYTHGAMSVYLDDAASGVTIYGNIFEKAGRAAFIGGGRDNTVENNIFIDCQPAVHIDARALGWAKDRALKGGGWHMYEKLDAVNHDEPPYSERYPELAKILKSNPPVPLGNVVRLNLCSGGQWLNLQNVKRQWVTFENNLVADDLGLKDPENADFSLKNDSPAIKMGFKPIPFEKIGPRPLTN